LFGELDRQIAEPAKNSQDFGVDIGEKVKCSPKEVVELVELVLGLVHIGSVAAEVLGVSKFVDEMTNDFYDSYSHRIGLCNFPIGMRRSSKMK
jgi:hypothetical protein